MELVKRSHGSDEDVAVRLGLAGATVGELAEALGGELAGAPRLFVDGRAVRADAEVGSSAVCRGSIISADGPVESAPGSTGEAGPVQLCLVGGVEAGQAVPLQAGAHVIGRAADCDIVLPDHTVSRRHCELVVGASGTQVRDLNSSGGTWVDGERLAGDASVTLSPASVVELGTVAFVVRQRRLDDRSMAVDPSRYAGANGEIPFNRPPRRAAATAPRTVQAPKAPPQQDKPRFNAIAIVAPAAAAGVMVVTTRNWIYAVVAGLTPIMAVFNWVDGRRRAGKSNRTGDRAFRLELESFTEEVRKVTLVERQRRQSGHPDLAEILRRASLPSVRLWERRASHPDYLQLHLAHGPQRWEPPIEQRQFGDAPPAEVATLIESASTLQQVPITADLAGAGPIGIVGERGVALSLARSLLCQAAVLHGPVDLPVVVLSDEDRTVEWDWAKWLPHVRNLQVGDDRMLLAGGRACNRFAERLLDDAPKKDRVPGEPRGALLFLVVDSDQLTQGKQAPVRDVLKGNRVPGTGIVIAASEDLLPAVCTTVVECHETPGEVTVTRPQEGVTYPRVVVAGLGAQRARECALGLARFEDPEIKVPGSSLPRTVRAGELLGHDVFVPGGVEQRWDAYGRMAAGLYSDDREVKPPMEGPIGRTDSSVLTLDIVGDGPHGFVGGTTGSGKTELLRSIVLGLAAAAGPDHLNFVFIDFKGGAGFEKLNELPHAVGLATNLNAALTERLLVCLQAELDYRQRAFRDASTPVDELHKYWQAGEKPLPRLLVVVDELAELVSAVPEFTAALVRIGRIGRTLGVHLLLATQRPGSVITTELRENTNYAIALRVREASNSVDIVGVPDAASIPARNATGRALLLVGGEGGTPVLFQSGYSASTGSGDVSAPISAAPFGFGPDPEAGFGGSLSPPTRGSSDPTELERIVDTMAAAHRASNRPAPRRPWCDPLPDQLPLADLIDEPTGGARSDRLSMVPIALADDLAAQAQHLYGWELARGNLLLYGVVGAGTTTGLAAVALAIDRTATPGSVQLYVLDCGAGELAALEPLTSVGAVVTSSETERQLRLAQRLLGELKERKASPRLVAARPSLFLLIDNFGGLTATGDSAPGLLDDIHRIFSEGPDVGIHVAASGDRPQAVPYRLADVAPQKWVMRLSDAVDYTGFGLSRRAPASVPPGRAFVAGSAVAVQIGWPGPDLPAAVAAQAALAPDAPRPPAIRTLPDRVPLDRLVPAVALRADTWLLPVGIANSTLEPFCLRLHAGEHAVIAGPARSGKSTLLRALADVIAEARPDCTILALLGRPTSSFAAGAGGIRLMGSEEELVAAVGEAAGGGPVLVLVDDAQLVADPTGSLERLLGSSGPTVHAVVTGRGDELRQAFGHWTQSVRKGRTGVVLKVAQPADGDAIGASLPFARSYDTRPGRGYAAVDGEVEFVQVPVALDA